MKRRFGNHLHRILSLGLCLTLLFLACNKKPDKNIILISIDTLRPDHLGCYGYEASTSPVLDRIADRGVVFENAFSSTSWTLPAHMALFTSLYDSVHNVIQDGMRLDENRLTLAEVMKHAGYQTAGFISAPYLSDLFGFNQGFDLYLHLNSYPYPDWADFEAAPVAKRKELLPILRDKIGKSHRCSHRDITSPRVFEKSTEWLREHYQEPFFLFLHFFDVHYDFHAPGEVLSLFDADYEGTLTGSNFIHNDAIAPGMDPRDFKRLMALYDAEIRFTDSHIGRILDVLRELGLEENTAVVITSDHGEEFLEHGKRGHRQTLYDEVIRIPLIVSVPWHEKKGLRVQDPVSIIDVMPTITDLFGIDGGREMMGRSLVSQLKGISKGPASLHLSELENQLKSVRSDTWKLIQDKKENVVLYDLVNDPGEATPLSPEDLPGGEAKKEAALRLIKKAKQRRERLKDAKKTGQDKALLKRLKGLGYMDTEPEDKKK